MIVWKIEGSGSEHSSFVCLYTGVEKNSNNKTKTVRTQTFFSGFVFDVVSLDRFTLLSATAQRQQQTCQCLTRLSCDLYQKVPEFGRHHTWIRQLCLWFFFLFLTWITTSECKHGASKKFKRSFFLSLKIVFHLSHVLKFHPQDKQHWLLSHFWILSGACLTQWSRRADKHLSWPYIHFGNKYNFIKHNFGNFGYLFVGNVGNARKCQCQIKGIRRWQKVNISCIRSNSRAEFSEGFNLEGVFQTLQFFMACQKLWTKRPNGKGVFLF